MGKRCKWLKINSFMVDKESKREAEDINKERWRRAREKKKSHFMFPEWKKYKQANKHTKTALEAGSSRLKNL